MKRRMSPLGASFGRGRSDGAAMASGSSDLVTNQEPAEVQEECSGKKKSKFQTFKKLFARKKRKEPQTAEAEAGLKASQSSDDVSKTSENNALTRSEKEKGSGSKISLGGKALSHDSVFVSDSSETNEALGASQDSIQGKVKSLQLQLKQAIRLGSPPSLICVKKTEDGGATSEDDGLPCSPPEYTTPRQVTVTRSHRFLPSALHLPQMSAADLTLVLSVVTQNQAQRSSSNSLQGADSDDDKPSCAASSRAMSPLLVPGDFSQPASPFGCLDNSAAKHKLGLRHKACNRRKPANRLDLRAGGDSAAEEVLTVSVPGGETEALEQQERARTEDERDDQLIPKGEGEAEEEETEEQEATAFQLRDEEDDEEEEGEDEPEAKQEVSPAPASSCPPEQSLSEEDVSDARSMSSSSSSSRASSPSSPRPPAEPPAALEEDPLSLASVSREAEGHRSDTDSSSEEELQGEAEDESSFLEEVLSSLKTPLSPRSPDADDVVLETKEEEVEEEEAGTEERVEIKEEEEEAEVEEPVGHQLTPPCSILTDQTEEEEEEEEAGTSSLQDEDAAAVGEEVKGGEEEVDTEEEDLTVERFAPHSDEEDQRDEEEEEEEEEVKSEKRDDVVIRRSLSQEAGVEEEEEEEEEEEMEKEAETEEEMFEESEEEHDGGGEEVGVNKGREEEEEEAMEVLPDSQGEEVRRASPVQEADEGAMGGDDDDDVQTTSQVSDEITEMGEQVLTGGQEGQENSNQNSEDEREGDEEEGGKLLAQEEVEEEEEEEAAGPRDHTGEEQEQESDETVLSSDMKPTENDLESKPLPPSPPVSDSNADPDQEPLSPSGKTTAFHINLVSPSSEKPSPVFHLPPVAADPSEGLAESPPPAGASSAEEEQADAARDEEREEREEPEPEPEPGVSPPASVTTPTDPGKVRFTIAPAWQRSQSSAGPVSPSSLVPGPGGDGKEQEAKAEPAADPGKARGAGSPTVKPAQTPAAVRTSDGSVVAEGNPENPFGVRLRKTSALLRFSSEEEVAESPVESPTFSPQPVGTKPSVCPPPSYKPAVPRKPEALGDAGGKPRRSSELAAGSDPPSWISVAKRKQKVYKENSLEEMTVKKEDQEKKSSSPDCVSPAVSREHQNKMAESTSKEISKPPVFTEKETRRVLSPATPVPPQPPRSQPLPSPVAPKPQVSPVTAKPPPPQPKLPQTALSPPTPVPVPSKPPPRVALSPLAKPATAAPTPASRTTAEKAPGFKAPGLPRPPVSPQRGLPPPALPQDEPPWMALAKKKAKAWSEMPQIVQ
ncbi:histone-lysine N-methyltransferase SETD1B isoform X4 [Kryptolebias marmoratus]|uniref:histone-lysine N-methyltransferase SETD1B isoform X4 n=1 Tax=Kryptolebias marmoratus TaxID=37003 RepID=UPI000D530876|nr:histone-lysine N-methyltransferase SETD1B isoform X4 [Kryptolebias marmoratus]